GRGMEFRAFEGRVSRATSRHAFSFSVCARSATLFFMNFDGERIRLFSFCLCRSSFGRRYASAPWEQALLFRLSAFWPFGAHPTGMGRSQAEQPNKTRFQSKYF